LKRRELLKRKRSGEYVPELEEMDLDNMSEWQKWLHYEGAGELVWKQEQDTWLSRGFEDDEEDHAQLRGSKKDDKHKIHDKNDRRRHPSQRTDGEATVDIFVMMFVFTLTRIILRVCATYRQFGDLVSDTEGTTNARTTNTNDITGTTTTTAATAAATAAAITRTASRNNSGRAALARLMVPHSINAHARLLQTARFRAWVTNLNRERADNGQPPLSLESLRLVLRDSDFESNDYEALMRFHEEATLAQSMGASQEEIQRCPHRVLETTDDDLLTQPSHHHHHHHHRHHPSDNNNAASSTAQQCPICLEEYQLQDRVRTIPCFHEFHADCIDPWLAHRAVCPICKHPVMGS